MHSSSHNTNAPSLPHLGNEMKLGIYKKKTGKKKIKNNDDDDDNKFR